MSTLTACPEPKLRSQPPAIERPVRVLHVVPELSSGGMERAMLRLVQRSRLHDQQFASGSGIVHGICALKEIKADLAALCPPDVPTWALGVQNKGRYGGWRALRGVVTGFRPDIVHARSTGTWFDTATALVGVDRVRLLLSFHGRTATEPVDWRRRLINRWTAHRASAVLTVSQEAAVMLRGECDIPGDKLVTIPNGVDTSLFCPAEIEDDALATRHALHLPPSANLAVCVANLLPIKGLDVLVRAWRQVIMADPLARLVVVGDGPLRGALESLIERSRGTRYIRLLGAREDIPTLLRAADVFVLPSWYEACSNATLEAMASGLPVVGCDVGGMRELVTPQRTGWLVPPGNAEALAHTILAALLDRNARHRVGAAGRDSAVKHFGIDTWVARYAALYRRLAGLRPARHERVRDDEFCDAGSQEDTECAE
jgi:glycosyltransferase involved in cell wall biosynthesis